MATQDYNDRLNQWHLELVAVRDLASVLFKQVQDYDQEVTSASRIMFDKFEQLIEEMPFPDN